MCPRASLSKSICPRTSLSKSICPRTSLSKSMSPRTSLSLCVPEHHSVSLCVPEHHSVSLCPRTSLSKSMCPRIHMYHTTGITQWLECQTHEQKVVGSSLAKCSSPGSAFCADSFQYPFHPHVTTVAHKRSWSLCQKCRWHVTAKHTCTLCMRLCMK